MQLETVADSYGGRTSDQGTEIGIPVFRVSSIADLLPDWISRASHQDLESCDAEDDWADGHVDMDLDVDDGLGRPHWAAFRRKSPPPKHDTKPLMARATRVSGLQRTASIVGKDTHTRMAWWDEFWKRLKKFEALLRVKDRVARFRVGMIEESI